MRGNSPQNPKLKTLPRAGAPIHAMRTRTIPTLLAAVAAMAAACLPARADGRLDVVAMYSSVSPAYNRTALPDGGFKPETFAFGDGGQLGGTMADLTLDKLRIGDIARLLAPSLAARDYVAASDPKTTDLLIMVYWGATDGTNSLAERNLAGDDISLPPPPNLPDVPNGGSAMGDNGTADPAMAGNGFKAQAINIQKAAADNALTGAMALENVANQKRDRLDAESADLLGYSAEMKTMGPSAPTALNLRRQELVDEVEESRYYVVLMAYDFRTLLLRKERKLLWETRFSIRARGHDFGKDVAAMAKDASRYFGRDSRGLVRDNYDAHVTIGTMRVVDAAGGGGGKASR